jgi:hypothetical protein
VPRRAREQAQQAKQSPEQQLIRLLDNPADKRRARRYIKAIRAETFRHARRLMGEAAGHTENHVKPDDIVTVDAAEED